MSRTLGNARWSTHPVPEDVSGECRYVQVLSDYGNLRIMVVPSRIDNASRAVTVISNELMLRKAKADYAALH